MLHTWFSESIALENSWWANPHLHPTTARVIVNCPMFSKSWCYGPTWRIVRNTIFHFAFSAKMAESMKKKLPWLKYDMKKAEYLEAKVLEKDAKKKLDVAAKLLNELKAPIEDVWKQ
ncbi:hypothetical protein L1887_34461 [Cichorium endivia]|nr:hypothetical protein L1887_34461 [Cichorium endivia]